MRRWWLFLSVNLALSLPLLAQDSGGSVTREIPNQVGVYECRLETNGKTLKPSDIVTIMRNGEPIGEATVLSVNGKVNCQVSLKGDFLVHPGDQIEFARSAGAPPGESPRRHATGHSPSKTKSTKGLDIVGQRVFTDSSRQVHVVAQIKNNGPSQNDPSTLVCGWENDSGRVVHTDRLIIPAVGPGKTISLELKSKIKQDKNTEETLSGSVSTARDGDLVQKLSIQSGKSTASDNYVSDGPARPHYYHGGPDHRKMSVNEVAKSLNVPTSQVNAWVRAGQLKIRDGKIDSRDVKKLIDKGIYKPNATH